MTMEVDSMMSWWRTGGVASDLFHDKVAVLQAGHLFSIIIMYSYI